jgi:hypothetical protein
MNRLKRVLFVPSAADCPLAWAGQGESPVLLGDGSLDSGAWGQVDFAHQLARALFGAGAVDLVPTRGDIAEDGHEIARGVVVQAGVAKATLGE